MQHLIHLIFGEQKINLIPKFFCVLRFLPIYLHCCYVNFQNRKVKCLDHLINNKFLELLAPP
jgi:hypothetical protein